MKKIICHSFKLDNPTEIILNDEDVIEYKQINYGEEIKIAALKFINNINIDNEHIEVIDINYDNFTDYHYKLMGGRFLAVKKIDEGYQYITSAGICFNCIDKRVIQIVKDSNKPTKVSYQYCDEVTMPLALVVKILLGKETKYISDLVGLFAKDEFDPTELNCYRALTKIYRKLFNIITTHNYSTYFNLERNVYLAMYRADLKASSFSTDEILVQKRCIQKKLVKDLNLPSDFIVDKKNLISYINDNTDNIISLHKSIGNEDYIQLYNISRDIQALEAKKDMSIIKIYSSSGQLENFTPVNYLVETNVTTIRGSFTGLYLNSLLSILRLKEYQIEGPDDVFLKNYINSLNLDLEDQTVECMLFVLQAYVNTSVTTDINNFLYLQKETVLTLSEIQDYIDILNTYLPTLMNSINNYNSTTYKSHEVKLIEHKHYSPLNTRILEVERKVIKTAIMKVFETLEDFNSKNKLKLYISDVTNDSINITSPKDISHIAIDTLNRILPNVLESSVKLKQYITHTDIIE